LRVAIFSEVYWPMVSGVGVILPRLADALMERGHAVRVYSASYQLPAGAVERPEVHRSPSVPLFVYPDVQWALPRTRDIAADLRRFQPDIAHVATEFSMGLTGVKLSQQLGIPVVASAHTDYQKYAISYGLGWVLTAGWLYLRWFYAQADRVLCPSGWYARYLQSRGVSNTGIWTRGVDTEEFNPAYRSQEYRDAFGAGPDDLLLTYVGRLAREKDLHLLLRAWEELRRVRGNAQLVLLGRGPFEDEIRRRAIPGVHAGGVLRGRELAVAYASADLFVFPSPTETFGNSLLEAMASGLPSLAVSAGGVVEFAQHGRNAWLVESGNGTALRIGLERLMRDGDLRERLREGSLHTAMERRWDVIYDKLEDDYRSAIARAAGARAA
jgi:glycosyltransferase involved in cell wall biosynthesis